MEAQEIKTKKCNRCGRVLPVTEFYKKASSKDGLQDQCRECHNESVRRSYQKKKNERKSILEQSTKTESELSEFTPRQLMEELKRRGFKWDSMYYTQYVSYDKI